MSMLDVQLFLPNFQENFSGAKRPWGLNTMCPGMPWPHPGTS